MRIAAVSLVAGLLAAAAAGAQSPVLVSDLRPTRTDGTEGLVQSDSVTLGGVAIQPWNDGVHGFELWRTDGTAGGSWLVADVCAGICTSLPRGLVALGGIVYFVADDGVHGFELWRTDGTRAGTWMIADVVPGPLGSDPDGLTVLGAQLVFSAATAAYGRELWTSDGSAAGTHLVADVRPGAESALEIWRVLPAAGGRVFLCADDGVHGRELWASDGTAPGTTLVADLTPGASPGCESFFSSTSRSAVSLGTIVVFAGGDDAGHVGLWASDGTAAGTVFLGAVLDPGNLRDVAVLGGEAWFAVADETGLWRTDGTLAGTAAVLPPEPGRSGASRLGVAGSLVYASARGADGSEQLWRTDGTSEGTLQLTSFGPSEPGGVFYARLTGIEGATPRLLFFAGDAAHGVEPWVSDGTVAGTHLLADLVPGSGGSLPDYFFLGSGAWDRNPQVGGSVVFRATAPDLGLEPYVTDGTGVQLLADVDAQGSAFLSIEASYPHVFAADLDWLGAAGSDLYAAAFDDATGFELWRAVDTVPGLELLADFTPGPTSSTGPPLIGAGDRLFVNAVVSGESGVYVAHGAAVTRVDAPTTGPSAVRAIGDGRVVGLSDTTVWASDGTSDGTSVLASVVADGTFDVLGPTLSFLAGSTLWTSDGTPAGTLPAFPAPGVLAAAAVSSPGGPIYVLATVDTLARAASGAPEPLASVAPVRVCCGWQTFVRAGSRLFFVGADLGGDAEPWVTDGTVGGTYRLADVRPGSVPSNVQDLSAVGERVYFTADDGVHGQELWTSDGTPAGTALVADLAPGAASASPRYLRAVDGVLLFAADDGVHGLEPWKVRGPGLAPDFVADLAPGLLPSSPQQFVALGDRVYFVATDAVHGFELWRLDARNLACELYCDGFESAAADRWSSPSP